MKMKQCRTIFIVFISIIITNMNNTVVNSKNTDKRKKRCNMLTDNIKFL